MVLSTGISIERRWKWNKEVASAVGKEKKHSGWGEGGHLLINYTDTKAKCLHLKNLPVKGLCGRCLSV